MARNKKKSGHRVAAITVHSDLLYRQTQQGAFATEESMANTAATDPLQISSAFAL